MRRSFEEAPSPGKRAVCLRRRERPHGDLGLREARERAEVRRQIRGHDLVDDMARFPETAEQDLGPREHQALHRGVAGVAQRVELLGRSLRGPSGRRGVPRIQRDLGESGPSAGACARVVGERSGTCERLAREIQVAELRVGDAAEQPPDGAVFAPDEAQGAQRLPVGERTRGDEQSLRRDGHRRQNRRTRRVCHEPHRSSASPMLLPRLAARA